MRGLLIPLVACIACAVVFSITAVSVRAEQNNVNGQDLSSCWCNGQCGSRFSKIETLYVDFKNLLMSMLNTITLKQPILHQHQSSPKDKA